MGEAAEICSVEVPLERFVKKMAPFNVTSGLMDGMYGGQNKNGLGTVLL